MRKLISGNVKAVKTLLIKQSLIMSWKPMTFVDRGLAWSGTLTVLAVFDTFERNRYMKQNTYFSLKCYTKKLFDR